MKREDLHKLLGGYAAGTLTDEERRALFEAALTDQALFNALANEEALRDTLSDVTARAQVLEALDTVPPSFRERFGSWIARPRTWAAVGAVAATLVIGGVFVFRPKPEPQIIAQTRPVVRVDAVQPRPGTQPISQPPHPRPQRAARRPFTPPPAAVGGDKEIAPPPAVIARAPEVAVATAQAPPALEKPATEARPLMGRNLAPLPIFSSAARDTAQPSARQLFYQGRAAPAAGVGFTRSEAKQKSEPAAAAPGLRYSLLRRNAEGAYVEVPLDTVLSAGEDVRLRIVPNEAGYLYVIAGEATLFAGPVEVRRPVLVEPRPGTLYAILSREADSAPPPALLARTRAKVTQSDQRIDKPEAARRDPAVYVVNAVSSPDARVLAEIHLNYR